MAQNLTNWFNLQNVSQKCIFKVRKFQFDTLSRFRMVEGKQERAYFAPPGKIRLRLPHIKGKMPSPFLQRELSPTIFEECSLIF